MQAAQEEDYSATGTIAALAVFALGFANLLAKAVLAASMGSIAYAVRFAIAGGVGRLPELLAYF
ncbi:hypothetical protein HFO41_25540 [Rhizobium leguminosarum]|uniref:hypothetical protein n=1 Tax=Rhizobium leguminosarum TaxID=384 RepID=UPI001A90D8EB|nr:hypothetical protein [Rhizobium leguminosarum]MBY5552212.1 hypothetical protein [Rhizobium leguminosarum]MBY5692148.1 hypothetical protein [Rhizobium leguminosarum]MBY5726616.1 hypothetical protein [Rhizobium leguminosarum]QSW26146.1 hypothetical protein J0664_09755 [Rhizobium leguminosarum]